MNRIARGVVVGGVIATLYSIYAFVLFGARGAAPFAANHTTLVAVLITYYSCGLVAGAVVGAMAPLARSQLGGTIVGSIAAFFVWLGIGVATQGNPARWDRSDWGFTVVIAIVFGFVGARIFGTPTEEKSSK